MKKKRILISVVVLVVLIAGSVFVAMQMNGQSKKDKEKTIENITRTYYEEYLYDLLAIGKNEDELHTFFSTYEKDGFKVSIENISKVSEIDVKKEMKKLGNSCQIKEDNIVIRPKAPYGKKDYTVKAVCK